MTEPTVPPAPQVPIDQVPTGALSAEQEAALAAAAAAAAVIRPPDTTRANAAAEIEKLKRDPEFRTKLLAGGKDEVAKWRNLHKAVGAPATPDEDNTELTKRVAALQTMGLDFSGEVGADLLNVLKGAPISPEIRRQVENRRTALMRDPGWAKKYRDGDVECRRTMATIAVLMSAQVERKVA